MRHERKYFTGQLQTGALDDIPKDEEEQVNIAPSNPISTIADIVPILPFVAENDYSNETKDEAVQEKKKIDKHEIQVQDDVQQNGKDVSTAEVREERPAKILCKRKLEMVFSNYGKYAQKKLNYDTNTDKKEAEKRNDVHVQQKIMVTEARKERVAKTICKRKLKMVFNYGKCSKKNLDNDTKSVEANKEFHDKDKNIIKKKIERRAKIECKRRLKIYYRAFFYNKIKKVEIKTIENKPQKNNETKNQDVEEPGASTNTEDNNNKSIPENIKDPQPSKGFDSSSELFSECSVISNASGVASFENTSTDEGSVHYYNQEFFKLLSCNEIMMNESSSEDSLLKEEIQRRQMELPRTPDITYDVSSSEERYFYKLHKENNAHAGSVEILVAPPTPDIDKRYQLYRQGRLPSYSS